MILFVVVNVGNEIDGRITSVKLEKVFKNRQKAEEYLNSSKISYVDEMKIENDVLKFMFERNVQEVVLEE